MSFAVDAGRYDEADWTTTGATDEHGDRTT